MEIIIDNFRSIDHKHLKLENQIYLLKGESGVGKSSIIEAIVWCFFGKCRNVSNINSKAKPEVTIIMNEIKITRSKNPESLNVFFSGKKYQKLEAQAIIDDNFLSYSNWELSTYLCQNGRNKLIYSSQTEKMDFLKEIIFGNELRMSETYLQKITTNIKSLEKDLNKLSGALEFANKELEKVKEEKKEFCEKYSNLKNKKNIQKKINTLEKFNEAKNLLRDRIEENSYQIKINELIKVNTEKLNKYELLIKNYPKDLNISFINEWSSSIVLSKEYKTLDNAQNVIPDETYPKDLNKLLELRMLSVKSWEIKEKYSSIEDIPKYLNQLIDKYQKYIKNKDKKEDFSKLQKAKKYQTALDGMRPKIIEYWEYIIQSLDLKFDDLDILKEEYLHKVKKIVYDECDIFECPKCGENLVMENDKLKISKPNISETIKEYFKKIEDFVNKEKLVLNKINDCKYAEDYEEYEEIDKENTEKEIEELKEYDSSIQEPSIISKIINQYKKNEKKAEILQKLSDLKVERFSELEYPKDINEYFERFTTINTEIKTCSQFLEDNKHKDIEHKVEDDTILLEEVNQKISEINDLILINNEYKIVEDKEKEIKKLEEKRKDLIIQSESNKKLEKIIKETESEVMNNNIDTINLQLNNILGTLFEDIHIELNMIKNLKNGEAKPYVNLKVVINGREYSDIGYLSGGECDRISLALTITFNLIMGSKIMLLDEVMSSLDAVNREKCLMVIKKYLKDKIILNVCHETIEGYYDQIIELVK